jgi:16S rRNA (cytidine1402-2'-O)-methyltransferase
MNILYIVATPIGNLGDITFRALEVLRSVDFILCEDTRVTKKLLDHYEIKTPTISYHTHSGLAKIEKISELLESGKDLALVSDAGTPGISDPGNKLIEELENNYRANSVVKFIPIPGASALTVAASIAGFSMDKFIFLGFPPVKKRRRKFFEEVVSSKYPVVFYESKHRILRTLEELESTSNKMSPRHESQSSDAGQANRFDLKLVVCRELTKKFETIYRGTANGIIEELQKSEIKGEFVVMVSKGGSGQDENFRGNDV